ncbi:MAG TPA: hypothetical protein VKA43_13870 [Gammaproteobacteria bacterium]|nr:hypothetical protein [Gammaproteobacteria bacterium]
MGFRVRSVAAVASLLMLATALSQEGFPLDGTWRGEWGNGDKRPVVIVMKWDGQSINGTINPGPNSLRFSSASLEPSDWTVRIEAQSRDGLAVAIDAKLENIGSYHRTLTGTWKQAGTDHAFKIARE